MLTTIVVFIIVLGLLVFVHEFGHFIVAKKSGMAVEEFGFGFPPRIAGMQKADGRWRWVWGHKPPQDPDRTVYSINWIPLGGFVKIRGENNEAEDDPKSFINRPFWPRLATLVAGVVMNLILAWMIMSVAAGIGIPTAASGPQDILAGSALKDPHISILTVVSGGPADKAGLQPGDTIVAVDHKTFTDSSQASAYILSGKGKVFDFEVSRGGKNLDIAVASLANPGPDQGPTGIELASVGDMVFPWYLAPWGGLRVLGIQFVNIASGLGQLFTGKVGINDLGGPVKIAQLTGQVTRMGFIYLMQFAAFLSINLAILNILPFPALDGGRVLFLVIEKIRGKRNNQLVEQWVNAIGFVLLILLMIIVTAHDLITIGIGHTLKQIIGG